MSSSLKPLQSTLESILGRLAVLESQAGIKVSPQPTTGNGHSNSPVADDDDDIAPALKAYDEHVNKAVIPFVNACDAIDGLKETGSNIKKVWMGIRTIIEIGTQCKKPADVPAALMPRLKPVQDAMADIRKARLDRKFDYHVKGIMEMLACASWVIMSSPPAPSSFIKETIGSTDFWSNKIRKEFKGKDENHIAFCNTMKALILDLSAYVREYHLSGLMWNPRGIAIEEFQGAATAPAAAAAESSTKVEKKRAPSPAGSGVDIMKELSAKRTSDGNSAATGLKKVSRDQQTWRKEYKDTSNGSALVSANPTSTKTVKPSQIKTSQKPVAKAPVCKFQSRGSKWIIENQTKTSNPNGVCKVEVKDPKEQVYIYKCEDATIQIKGKLKSVILDSCKKTSLVFDSAISSCEVVNSKSVQIQSTGVCPSFCIDKTDGCLVYLSEKAVSVTTFVTSKSTEMNVSWPDGESGEHKEAPIPEQFIHRLKNGAVTSEVSDLYH